MSDNETTVVEEAVTTMSDAVALEMTPTVEATKLVSAPAEESVVLSRARYERMCAVLRCHNYDPEKV